MVIERSYIGVTAKRERKKKSAAKYWFQTPQNGRVPSVDFPPMSPKGLCKFVLQIQSLEIGKNNLTSTFLTEFTKRINELISFKYFASHR